MARLIIQYLLPLLLPFLLYLGYASLTREKRAGWLDDLPWIPLSIAGLVLLAATLTTWSLLSGAAPDTVYVPPHMEDGRIVPGHAVER
jgi:hypothetical protein